MSAMRDPFSGDPEGSAPSRTRRDAALPFGSRQNGLGLIVALLLSGGVVFAAPAAPESIEVQDRNWDEGDAIEVRFPLSVDDVPSGDPEVPDPVLGYEVSISSERKGHFKEAGFVTVDEKTRRAGRVEFVVDKLHRGEAYFVRVRTVGPNGSKSEPERSVLRVVTTREQFMGSRAWLAVITLVVCGAVVAFIAAARSGMTLKVRKIAGLEAIDEAVGRATEMGRSCLFVPGIQDINDIQTVAGLAILSRVAGTAAAYDAEVEVPTSKSLVMTAAQETVSAAFLAAGRPDTYREDSIYYVTDEQFGYVAYLSGHMVREEPAACFYMGSFFAESLILAESGNAIGAIQIAGTAQPSQLPFFVAACDYTLIGEEFFAASAYLSENPDELGSLKGQDVGKLIVGALIVIGCLLATITELTGNPTIVNVLDYLKDTVLK